MFWFVLGATLLIVFVSVVFGLSKSRRDTGRRLSNQEKMNLAKASGGLPNRKES
jgi:hypothetical protein